MDEPATTTSRARRVSSALTQSSGSYEPCTPLPQSKYLQDLLRERKAESSYVSRTRRPQALRRRGRDDSIFDDNANGTTGAANRLYDSSPIQAPTQSIGQDTRHDRRASAAGQPAQRKPSQPKAMGVRELDEHMDRLTKQNFDLKLEIYHLRQRITTSEAKLQATERLEQQNQELQEVNEALVAKLEITDHAISEAVGRICVLEAQVEEAGLETSPSPAQLDSTSSTGGHASTVTTSSPLHMHSTAARSASADKASRSQHPQPIADRFMDLGRPQHGSPKRLARMPSFLTDKNPSTSALRSLYLHADNPLRSVTSFATMTSRRDDRANGSEDVLNSPRLSVLSESSFLSVYGLERPQWPAQEADVGAEVEDDEEGDVTLSQLEESPKKRRIARVSEWVEERRAVPINKLSGRIDPASTRSVEPLPASGFLGEGIRARPDRHAHGGSLERSISEAMAQQKARKGEIKSPTMGGPIFANDCLPPTPDTMSVHTQALNRSRSDLVERSILDTTPQAAKTYPSLVPVRAPNSSRPQTSSSMEIPQRDPQDEEYDDLQSTDGDYKALEYEGLQQAYDIQPNLDYPCGDSITKGTPSRFRGPMRQPMVGDFMFNGEGSGASTPYYLDGCNERYMPLEVVRQERSPALRTATGRSTSSAWRPPMPRSQSSPTDASLLSNALSNTIRHIASGIVIPQRSTSRRQRKTRDPLESKVLGPSSGAQLPAPGVARQAKKNSISDRIFRRSGSSPVVSLQTMDPPSAEAKVDPLGRSLSLRARPPPQRAAAYAASAALSAYYPSDPARQSLAPASDDSRSSSALTTRIFTPASDTPTTRRTRGHSTARSQPRSDTSSTLHHGPPVALETQYPVSRGAPAFNGHERSASRHSDAAASSASGTTGSASSVQQKGRGRKWSFGAVAGAVLGERIGRAASLRRARARSVSVGREG